MSIPVLLSQSQHASCVLKSLPAQGGGYLSCTVRENEWPPTFKPQEILRGSRPPQCEIPSIANRDPMGTCAYKYHALQRCGCPDLDPNKNPQIWQAYVEAVKNAFKARLVQPEITLTIFASGYLLQDSELLDRLFMDPEIQAWQGRLSLQFIDLKYKVEDVKLLQDQVSEVSNENNDWTTIAPAIVLGICGGASAIYGIAKKNRVAVIAGLVLIVAALILGGASSNDQKGKDSTLNLNTPIIKTIGQFLEVAERQAPFPLQTDFYPNAGACIESGKESDIMIGYDIDNTLNIFYSLRALKLKPEGKAIVVTKEKNPHNGTVMKMMRQANGPAEEYTITSFL